MVGMMRIFIGALAFAVLSGGAWAAPRDLSGVWIAEEQSERGRMSAGYFRAELTQDAEGRLSGRGAVDSCTRCAGFMEYALIWEGAMEGDVLVLTGAPERPGGRFTPVRFEGRAVGDGFEGVISGVDYNKSMRVVMTRAAAEP